MPVTVTNVGLRELRVFLALAEELHFAHTAERLGLTPSRVSQTLRDLERKIGGQLFLRTSRHVELTTLGKRLQGQLIPAHTALVEALEEVQQAARGPIGSLRVGFTFTTVEKIAALVEAFEARYPQCEVELREVDFTDPYGPLRRGQIDVLVNWHAVDEPDLTLGPVIDHLERFLAVAASHPLAARSSVSIEDLADYPVRAHPPGVPRALYEAIIPSETPAGRPIPRAPMTEKNSVHELLAEVARGKIIHPTVNVPPFRGQTNILLTPIHDLPPLALGLIWLADQDSAAVAALARLADGLPAKPSAPGTS